MSAPISAVFDCNVLLQALSRPRGPAGQCFDAVLCGSVELYISRFLLQELADVVSRPSVITKLKLTAAATTTFFDVLCANAKLIKIPEMIFRGCRDPDDDLYINLAISLKTPVIVSRDKDLLDMALQSSTGKPSLNTLRPELRILTPPEFLIMIREQLP